MADYAALPLGTGADRTDTVDLRPEQHGACLFLLILAGRGKECAVPGDMEYLKR